MYDTKYKSWVGDEWLIGICRNERIAKDFLREWADGRPFDDALEVRITRYFQKRRTIFEQGPETAKTDPEMSEKIWLRYYPYEVKEDEYYAYTG